MDISVYGYVLGIKYQWYPLLPTQTLVLEVMDTSGYDCVEGSGCQWRVVDISGYDCIEGSGYGCVEGTIYQPLRSGRIWHKVNF